MTLEAGKDGKPGGYVSVTGEPTYKATLKTLAFDGAKMTATYEFPPDPASRNLAATFEGDAAKGTWSSRAAPSESASAPGPSRRSSDFVATCYLRLVRATHAPCVR